MHLIRQIQWFRLALALAIILSIAFIVVFGFGISTVVDADKASKHTADTLSILARVQQQSEHAVNEARLGLFSNIDNRAYVKILRDSAVKSIDELDEFTNRADPVQNENIQSMKTSMLYRYSLQDQQLDTSTRKDGELIMDQSIVQQVAKATYDLELSIARVRNHELGLLFQKDLTRSVYQWRVIKWMITFMVLSMMSTIITLCMMLNELRYRQQIAERLKVGLHKTADGRPIITDKDVNELLDIINQGSSLVHNIKSSNGTRGD